MNITWIIVIIIAFLSLLISIIIPVAIIFSNFRPKSFFVKLQFEIVEQYFSTELANAYLACCYRSKFFYLNSILTAFISSIAMNWLFFIIYYFVVSSLNEGINYFASIPNIIFLVVTFFLSIVDVAFLCIMYLLLKKYRNLHKFNNLENVFNNLTYVDFNGIKFLNGANQTKLFRTPINNFINSIKMIYHNVNKTNEKQVIDKQIIKCIRETLFLFSRNIKYTQIFDPYVLATNVKISNLEYPITSLMFLKIINNYLLASVSIIQSTDKKEHIEKLLSTMLVKL